MAVATRPQPKQLGAPTYIGAMTVAQLNALTGVVNGTLAYATNGRALTGGVVSLLFSTEAAGAGTGCLVSYSTNTSTWRIAGTTMTVAS